MKKLQGKNRVTYQKLLVMLVVFAMTTTIIIPIGSYASDPSGTPEVAAQEEPPVEDAPVEDAPIEIPGVPGESEEPGEPGDVPEGDAEGSVEQEVPAEEAEDPGDEVPLFEGEEAEEEDVIALSEGVTDWESLRLAITAANNGLILDNTILLLNSVTRTGATTTANDLPIITNPNLVIDGGGNVLSFGATTINRAGITLKQSGAGTFTLRNIVINRTNATTYPLISAANGTTATSTTGYDFDDKNVYGAGWTVDISGLSTDATPTSGLLSLSDGAVNFTGTISWPLTAAYYAINARSVNFDGALADIRSANTTVRLSPSTNNTSTTAVLSSTNNANISLYSTERQAIYMNEESTSKRADVLMTDQSKINAYGDGGDTGADGATMSIVGSGGMINLSNGAQLIVESRKSGTGTSGGQPALISQVANGTFNVDGANTLLQVSSRSSGHVWGATLRFRLVGGQTFNVTNGGVVHVEHWQNPSSSYSPAAIRFGSGTGNQFNIKSGGRVTVINHGDGTVRSGSGDGYNKAIEYDANNWGFDLEGEMSTVELVADCGPVISTDKTNGSISVGEGSVFVATGITPATTDGIFRTGSNFTFTSTTPLYYDFTNKRAGGGLIFDINSTGSSFTSTNSDVAIWRKGMDITGDPYRSWSNVTYQLNGTDFQTFVSGSPATEINSGNFGTGTTTGMPANTRINGNNAKPEMYDMLPATNADQYVRSVGGVREGAYSSLRPLWTGEGHGVFRVWPVDNPTVPYDTVYPTYVTESVNPDAYYGTLTEGVMRLNITPGFLRAGDKYQLITAWRGEVDPADIGNHFSDQITPEQITVLDKVPPVPGVVTLPNPSAFAANQTHVEGTYSLGEYKYQGGENNNQDYPVRVYAVVNGVTVRTDTVITDGVVVTAGGQFPVYGTVEPPSSSTKKWTYDFPDTVTLAPLGGDVLQFILEDASGNGNPLTNTVFHDTTRPQAATVTTTPLSYRIDADANIYIGRSDAAALLASVDLPLALIARFHAHGYDVEHGGAETPIVVAQVSPAFAAAPGRYDVTFAIQADTTFTVTRSITVLPADVVTKGATYIIGADDIASMGTLRASSVTDAELITESNARAWLITEVVANPASPTPSGTIEVANRNFPPDDSEPGTVGVGLGHATFNVAEESATQVANDIHIENGNAPVLTISNPVALTVGSPVLADADFRAGVSANDDEDGVLTSAVTYSGTVDTTTIGLYPVVYSVTDSDGYSVTRTRTYAVGPYEIGDEYILYAGNFEIGINDVSEANPAKNAQIINKSGAHAWRYADTITGGFESADEQLRVDSDGGYRKAEDEYDITLTVADELTLTTDIVGKVVDAGETGENDEFFVSGDDILINTTLAATITDTQILALANARAWTLPDFTAIAPAVLGAHGVTATPGQYQVTIVAAADTSADADKAKAFITVTVDDGHTPTINAGPDVTVDLGSTFDFLAGVQYEDAEDAEADLFLNYIVKDADGASVVPGAMTSVAGGYVVTYTVTDTDGNEATDSKTVLVNDGTWRRGSRYILHAENFVLEQAVVTGAPDAVRDTQIKTESGAYALTTADLSPVPDAYVYVVSAGGYTDTEGLYSIRLGVRDTEPFDDVDARQDIRAIVYEDNIDIGNDYIITSRDFSLSVSQAIAKSDANLLTWGNVKVYDAITFDDVTADSLSGPEVVSDSIPASGTPSGGTPYEAVYRAKQEHGTSVTSAVTVVSGNAPELTVATPKEILVGSAYDPLVDVTVSDVEDGAALTTADIVINGGAGSNVITAVPGVYADEYSVTDSDGNESTATRVVVVNDGSIDVGDKYVLWAHSFGIRKALVAATATGRADQIVEKTEAEAYSALTGDPATVIISSDGGYINTEGAYSIVLAVEGDNGSDPAGRNVTARVIDRDVVVTIDGYIIAADNFTVNSTDETGITNLTLLTRSNAAAWALDDALTPVPASGVEVASYGGGRNGTSGNYPLRARVTANPQTYADVIVTVSDGSAPIITLTTPVSINVGDTFDATANVSATDAEDNDLTSAVTNNADTALNVNVVGVYPVTYRVTDSDHNETTKIRVVIVGPIVVGEDYILEVSNFVTLTSAVTGTDAEILSNAGARAWLLETGEPAQSDLKVFSDGGYTDTAGDYNITIGASAGTDPIRPGDRRAIIGKVVDGDYIGRDGDYIIVASDAELLLSEVPNPITDAYLVNLNGVAAYKRSDLSLTPVAVVEHDVAGAEGAYHAKYAAAEAYAQDPATTAVVRPAVNVTIGNAPTLEVSTPHEVALGSGAYNYSYGVTASDVESTPTVTHVGDVDTDAAGVYLVSYTATDSDGNEVSKDRVVVVNDGTYTVDADYILKAESYVIQPAQVLPGSQSHVFDKTKAAAWDSRTGVAASLSVTSFGGYAQAPGTYDIVVAVQNKLTVTRTVEALVVDAEILVETDNYYIAADAARINSTLYDEAEAADLVTYANARAWKIDRGTTAGLGLTSAPVDLDSFTGTLGPESDGTYDGVAGDYLADFRVAASPTEKVTLVPISVGDGGAPALHFSNPLTVSVGTAFTVATALGGVTATDTEDDLASLPLTPTANAANVALISANMDTWGVYTVEISVTDSDFNTTTDSRTVIVDDGTIDEGDEYILRANYFPIEVGEVETAAGLKEAQILGRSDAQAWLLDGTPAPLAPIDVIGDGGYDAAAGVYTIQLGVTGDAGSLRVVKALVYEGHITIGDDYIIVSKDYSVSVSQATAADAVLLGLGAVNVYAADTYAIQSDAAAVHDRSDLVATPGGPYDVVYRVVAEPATRSTSLVTVLGDAAPELSVSTPVEILVGGTYDPMSGVTATDDEDGTLPVSAITLNGGQPTNVLADTAGVYVDTYTARDSDDNVSLPVTRVIVVNDGTYSVGEKYILRATSFAIRKTETLPNGTDDEIRTHSAAQAWNALTGAAAPVVVFEKNGYYTDGTDTYDIQLRVGGDTGAGILGSDQGKAIRDVKAIVLDNDVVVVDGDWIIAADNVRMNSAAETGVTNDHLKDLANVTAYQRDDALTPSAAAVRSYGGSRTGTAGVYPLVFEVTAHTATSVSVTATVSDGSDPVVTVSSPVQIPVGGPFNANAGMSATDAEDGDLTSSVTNDAATSLNVDVVGVYIVTYTVEDSDFNEGTAQRVVVVDDGTIIVGPVYIVRAQNFVILKDDVTGTDAEILSRSGAYAWESATGTLRMDVLTVANNDGYQAVVEDYSITVAAGASTRSIIGKVVEGGVIHTGDEYTIVAEDASIRLSEVPGTITDDILKGWNQVSAYKNSDLSPADVTVVASTVAAAVGDYTVTYAVTADASATVTPHVLVSIGNPPELTVTTPHEVQLGSGPYDYEYGVTALDQEAPPTLTYIGDVDTDTAGIYLVEYTLTDTDDNQVVKSRVVVVNDGTYFVDANYILRAESFVIRAAEALPSNQAQVLAKSKAKAWNSVTGAEVAATVADFDGYMGTAGSYDIEVAVDLDHTVTRDIEALVVDGEYVVEGADYYIVADPVEMNTTVDLTHPNLVTLANAAAWKIDRGATAGQGLTPATAELESYTGLFTGTAGNFEAIFRVAEEPTTRTYGLPPSGGGVPVSVTDGVGPTLNIPAPLVVQQGDALTAAMILNGVTATDPEDNLAGVPLTGPTARASDIALIHTDTAGVYRVQISVTDSDSNTATGYRAVIVDDGTIIVGTAHILRARNFEIEILDVAPGDAAQILTRSQAEVWELDGTPSSDLAEVRSVDGYTNAVYVYFPRIGVAGDAYAEQTIRALVYLDNIDVGDDYIITSVDFTIGVGEAATATDANLITWGEVQVRNRADYTPVLGVAAEVQDRTQLQVVAGGPYPVTYRVIAEPATRSTSNVWVTDGTPPTISVTTPVEISVGGAYDPLTGVTATDTEDGTLPQSSITLNDGNPSTVDRNVPGVYTDTYVARDSDGNVTAPQARVVVVNDGTFDVGTKYILRAHSYAIRKTETEPTGTDSEIFLSSGTLAWNALTGLPATPVVAERNGYYTDGTESYTLELRVEGDPGDGIPASDAGKAIRSITAKVLDRDVVVTQDGYIIAADNISINTAEETGISDTQLISRANAEAWQQNDTLTSEGVNVVSYTGLRNGTPGTYSLAFEVAAHPATGATVVARVSDGAAPQITVSSPVDVPVGGPFDPTAGAAATDAEDGNLTSVMTNDAATAVNLGTAGVYTVTYSVEDSDHNVTTTPRVVVVNDGTIHVGGAYILEANSFLILKSAVTGTDSEILSQSGARAWDAETGDLKMGDLKVVADGGYTDTVAEYAITIGANPGTDPVLASDRVNVVGKVVEGGHIHYDDEYAIVADDAHVRLSEVPNPITDATLVGWNGTVAYNRNDLSAVGVTVVSHTVVAAIGTYSVTYEVTGVPAVTITPRVYVEVGTPPTISVVTPHEVALGSGAYDYNYGVTASDDESTPTIAYVGAVDTDAAGTYLLRYTATDSDGNVAVGDRVVVVNDGTYVVDDDYILKAESFVVRKLDVVPSSQPDVLGKTKAKAWNALTGVEVSAVVMDFGGYAATVGDYTITVAVGPDHTITKQVQAKVIDADIVIEGDEYYIAARSTVRMSPQTDLTQTPAGLVSLANARAWKIDRGTTAGQGMTPATAELDSYTGVFDGTLGVFAAVFRVGEEPTTRSTDVTVTVSNGTPPTLSYVNPLEVPWNGALDVLSGVSASDAEDGPLNPVANAADVALVNTAVPGVYTVGLSVTDSDGETATGSRTVLVNDGTYGLFLPDAILHAAGFGIAVANVDESGRDAQILAKAGAAAWDIGGVPISNPDFRVIDAGGYCREQGTYPIVLQLGDDESKRVNISAFVTGATMQVTFNGNGSPNNPSPSSITVWEPHTTIGYTPAGPAWAGYTFRGWYTNPSGTGQAFTGSTQLSGDITVYAVWEKNAEVAPPKTPPISIIREPGSTPPTIIERVVETVREAVSPGSSTSATSTAPAASTAATSVPAATAARATQATADQEATPVEPDAEIEDTAAPETTPPQTIPASQTPSSSGNVNLPQPSPTVGWSLVNLLLMLFGLETLIFVYFLWRRREDPDYEEQNVRNKVLMIVLAVASFGNVLLYIFTQPAFDSTMLVADKWTLPSAALLAAAIVAGILLNIRKNEDWDEESYEA
jgi:uncharacterized repeat protein (TIGR02543 family)